MRHLGLSLKSIGYAFKLTMKTKTKSTAGCPDLDRNNNS